MSRDHFRITAPKLAALRAANQGELCWRYGTSYILAGSPSQTDYQFRTLQALAKKGYLKAKHDPFLPYPSFVITKKGQDELRKPEFQI